MSFTERVRLPRGHVGDRVDDGHLLDRWTSVVRCRHRSLSRARRLAQGDDFMTMPKS